jgi:hypothetical protein
MYLTVNMTIKTMVTTVSSPVTTGFLSLQVTLHTVLMPME